MNRSRRDPHSLFTDDYTWVNLISSAIRPKTTTNRNNRIKTPYVQSSLLLV